MTIITLLTDFGLEDTFVGVMKGVILSIAPDARIVDLTHAIRAQQVLEGALELYRAVTFFPAGSVHVAVVDPGVGTSRRPMAARIGFRYFVGPDNGLFTPLIEDAVRSGRETLFVHLNNPEYWLPNVSHTFHGRDIFAPAAAHVAAGTQIEKMGTIFDDPVLLSLPKPEKTNHGYRAHVTVIDVYGNLTTDLKASEVANAKSLKIKIKGHEIHGMVESYGHSKTGDLVGLEDSEGYLEIAVVNGKAARLTGAIFGDPVEVIIE